MPRHGGDGDSTAEQPEPEPEPEPEQEQEPASARLSQLSAVGAPEDVQQSLATLCEPGGCARAARHGTKHVWSPVPFAPRAPQ